MRALIQRVSTANVSIEGEAVGQIGPGLVILICAMQGDGDDAPAKMAAKIAKLRVFKDDDGKMNRSILDTGGSALIVSQFTLAGDTSRGNRPGFSAAAAPEDGRAAYEAFIAEVQALGITTQTGRFGADMAVSLTNDGPVTLWLEI
ncbi:D-tyrosyl-tRNA(Tyr) deacylase [Salipiger sp. IMCC34102]|uniref:D-aminoacyl-tRNA deacylase n=1 Tax=Salipiger sp. IMCC34102 TaxID=2510647 RepID=UPI00101C032F|nr:D-aminoacyl-tRNA deacylase [Salipiger sp. IMCC34102]RYH01872.1 D-tyrosyl-tRNA(Tyr) deacylase [Salipiger sp. IMCC34102]